MRNILFFSVIIIGIGVLIGMGLFKDRYMSKDGVKIVIYKQGKEIPIDPDTPRFKELQEKCEEFLSSANDVLRDFLTKEKILKAKKTKLGIEITYLEPIEIKIPFFNSKAKADHLLIPLTDKYVNKKKNLGTAIFFYGPGYGVEYMGPYWAPKDVTEIINLLKSIGIDTE